MTNNFYPTFPLGGDGSLQQAPPRWTVQQQQQQQQQAVAVPGKLKWYTPFANNKNKVLNGVALTFAWLAILGAIVMAIFWMVTAGKPKPNDDGEERELFNQTQSAWFQISALLFLLGIVCQLRLVVPKPT